MLNGTASFELEPPDEAEMLRRFHALTDAGYPYLVAEDDGPSPRLCLRRRLPAASGLPLQRREFDLSAPTCSAAASAACCSRR